MSWARGYPDGNPSFVPLFRGFRLADRCRSIFDSCRADAAVGNLHLLGNCVPLKLEVGSSFSLNQNPRRNLDRTSRYFWPIGSRSRRILKRTACSAQSSSKRLLSSRLAWIASSSLNATSRLKDARASWGIQVNFAFSAPGFSRWLIKRPITKGEFRSEPHSGP